jgi:iron uptake system EfeUOB component EfeO/EfeM
MFNIENMMTLTSYVEAYWMIQNKMDKNEVPKIFSGISQLAKSQDDLVDYIDDYNLEDIEKKSFNNLSDKIARYNNNIQKTNFDKYLKDRTKKFCQEVDGFLNVLETKDLNKSKKFISKCSELFRGAQGIRHIDFIGYKK